MLKSALRGTPVLIVVLRFKNMIRQGKKRHTNNMVIDRQRCSMLYLFVEIMLLSLRVSLPPDPDESLADSTLAMKVVASLLIKLFVRSNSISSRWRNQKTSTTTVAVAGIAHYTACGGAMFFFCMFFFQDCNKPTTKNSECGVMHGLVSPDL